MKLGAVTKLDKRKKITSKKKTEDDVMLTNCEATVIFFIYGQFGAIWKPSLYNLHFH